MFRKIRSLINRLEWYGCAKKFKNIGKDSFMGTGFSVKNPEYIVAGDNFKCGKDVRIQIWPEYHGKTTGIIPELIIGNNVSLTERCFISCMNRVVIGDGTLLGSDVFVTDNSHGRNIMKEAEIPPGKRELYSKGPVEIGKNVWIGKSACIMPGVKIGDGCIVGANSVVTHDIPSYSIAVGAPAKVISTLNDGV